MTAWCPLHLQDISQLDNYYRQLVLEKSFTLGYDFPNAIYLDAVDVNGTIRTGTALFGYGITESSNHTITGYAYAGL